MSEVEKVWESMRKYEKVLSMRKYEKVLGMRKLVVLKMCCHHINVRAIFSASGQFCTKKILLLFFSFFLFLNFYTRSHTLKYSLKLQQLRLSLLRFFHFSKFSLCRIARMLLKLPAHWCDGNAFVCFCSYDITMLPQHKEEMRMSTRKY